MTAESFLKQLQAKARDDIEHSPKENQRIGVKMKDVFDLAKENIDMPLDEVVKLLQHSFHEARVGAVSILDFLARSKKTSEETRKKLYEIYLANHDSINTWDLVDRAAPYVVGGYLFDKSRDPLYKLARSTKPMERRTAIVATYYFIRQNDVDDTFKIAQILANDTEKYVQLAVGSWLREAGKKDKAQLLTFLKRNKTQLAKPAWRYAIEKLSDEEKNSL